MSWNTVEIEIASAEGYGHAIARL